MPHVLSIAQSLRRQLPGPVAFGTKAEETSFPGMAEPLPFVIRRHRASQEHLDLRVKILQVALSFVVLDPISLDPAKPARMLLMEDHNPEYLWNAYTIAPGNYGAGPSFPVEGGVCFPESEDCTSFENEMLRQLGTGRVKLWMYGEHLRGSWLLRWTRENLWSFGKLQDEYAAVGKILALDRSLRWESLDDFVPGRRHPSIPDIPW